MAFKFLFRRGYHAISETETPRPCDHCGPSQSESAWSKYQTVQSSPEGYVIHDEDLKCIPTGRRPYWMVLRREVILKPVEMPDVSFVFDITLRAELRQR